MQSTAIIQPPEPLIVPPQLVEIKPEQAVNEISVTEQDKINLDKASDLFIQELFTINKNIEDKNNPNPQLFEHKINQIKTLGNQEIIEATRISNNLMETSLGDMLKSDSSLNQKIASDMIALRTEIDKLNPSNSGINFKENTIVKGKKLFGIIPLPNATANKIQQYFMKYENGQQSINKILDGLASGRAMLVKNNQDLNVQKHQSWQNMNEIRKNIYFCNIVYDKIESKLNYEKINGNVTEQIESIIKQDILFPIQQKITDLETQLAVSVNGYLAYDLIRKTNDELINGVSRCETTTVSALKTAVTIANSVYQQGIVLNAITSVKETTENILLSSSELLKTQGAKIYQDSASATIDPKILEENFNNLYETVNMVNNYRNNALENLKKDRELLSKLNEKAYSLSSKIRLEKVSSYNLINK